MIIALTISIVGGVCATIAANRALRLKREKNAEALEAVKLEAFYKLENRRSVAVELRKSVALGLLGTENAPIGTLLTDVTIDQVYLWEVEHLSKNFKSEAPNLVNHMHGTSYNSAPLPENAPTFIKALSESDDQAPTEDQDASYSTSRKTHYNKLIGVNECVLADIVRKPGSMSHTKAFIRAGPRRTLHFNPAKVNAAIVTCGGLCPGLNNVVRELTNSLIFMYGIKGKVWGIRGGYKGFYDPETPPIDLNPAYVENIHHEGGTVLASSRGGFDLEKIIDFIKKKNIKQLYVIGGDGTHRGAFIIHEGCMEKGLNVAVAGIPKTIDNDVDHIDRSFGFQSSVEAAQEAIRCAKTEARCNLPNGVGIVKLMGRSAGFIAAYATLGSGDVDLCLLPEVPIILDGELGCLPHLYERVKEKGFAVVVVAEGAGEDILGESTETDASGNKKLPAIGEFMKKATEDFFKTKGETATVKYIDPSYMIRSCPANASDSLYCMQLAQNAVHGAMAGFTGFSVGLCKNKMCLLPIPELVATSPRMMNNRGRTYERILALTRQPNTVPSNVPLNSIV